MAGRKTPPIRPASVVALALLLIGPVAILPGALNRFVLVKVACVAAWAAIALLLPAVGRLPRPVVLLVCTGGVVLSLTAILGDQPYAQLVGRAPRFEGLAVLSVYVLAGVAGARLLGPGRSERTEWWTLRLLSLAALAVGFLAVLEAFGFTPLESSVSRPGSLFGNASDQGAWAVLVLGPLAARAVRSRDLLVWSGAVAAGLTVATSESRGALLAALVVCVSLALLLSEKRASIALAGLAVGVVGVALLLPAARSRVLGDNALAAATVPGRQLLWGETWQLFLRHPVLGVGPSGFADSVTAIHSGDWYLRTGTEVVDSPHSWPLQALTAGGPLLLLLALAIAALTFREGVRLVRSESTVDGRVFNAGLLAGLLGYGAALLVHFTSPGPTAAAAVFGGALLAVPARTPSGPPNRRAAMPARVAAVAAAVAAAALLVGAFAEVALKSAISAAERDDLSAADQSFHLARTLRPWDPDLPAAAGHAFAVLAGSGNVQAAALAGPWLDAARRLTPGSASVLTDLASVAETQQDFQRSADLLDQALTHDPNNPQILLQRGVVYAELHQYADAERLLLRAASLAPHSPDPWTDLATLYQLQGRSADAAAATAKAAGLRGG